LYFAENLEELFEKNLLNTLLKACPKTSLPCLKQILSPLLHHTSQSIRRKTAEVLFHAEPSGELTPESKAQYLEYLRQHLQMKLLRVGILLQQSESSCESDLVTYKGELHTNRDVERVLCHATAPSSLSQVEDISGADKTLSEMTEVLHIFSISSKLFINMLLCDEKSIHKFCVVDHDWKLPTLSDVLLEDLRSGQQNIVLRDKMEIISSIIEATLFAHKNEVLLRSFTAESFLVRKQDDKMLVAFWDVKAARLGVCDTMEQRHYTGRQQNRYLGNCKQI